MRMRFIVLFSLLFGILLSGCSNNPEKVYKPAPKTPQYNVHVNWAKKFADIGVDKFSRLIPVAAQSKIVMADTQGQLFYFDKLTGKLIWKKVFNTRFSGGPKIEGDFLILGTQSAEVYALSLKDGSQYWKQKLSSEILSTPQISGGVVVVQTNDGKVFGLSAKTGRKTWVYERNVPVLSLRGNSSPVIADDQVFAGFASGRLVSLALDDGKLLWESTLAVPKGRTELERMTDIDGPIVYDKGLLYVSAYHGQVAALDALTGRIVWTREMSSQLGVTVGEGLVFVTSAIGQIWALDKESGATLWMQDKLEELANTRPVIMGKQLVVGDVTGELYWLSMSDGRLLGHLSKTVAAELSGATEYADKFDNNDNYFAPAQVESSVTFRPVIVDNQLIVTYQNGVLASITAVN